MQKRINKVSELIPVLTKRGWFRDYKKIYDIHGSYDIDSRISGSYDVLTNLNRTKSIILKYDVSFNYNKKLGYVEYDGIQYNSLDGYNELLRLIPCKKVYTYSCNSTNFRAIYSIYRFIKSNNLNVFSDDIISKLSNSKRLKEAIRLINESYPNELPLTKLAMLCKLKCMSGQSRNIIDFRPYGIYRRSNSNSKITDKDSEIDKWCELYKNQGNYFNLHQRMEYSKYDWKGSWKNLRAMCRIFTPMIKITKDMIKLSEKAASLKPYMPNPDEIIGKWINGERVKMTRREATPWLYKDHKSEKLPEVLNINRNISDLLTKCLGPIDYIMEGTLDHVGINVVDGKTELLFITSNEKLNELNQKLKIFDFGDLNYRVITNDDKPINTIIII